MYAEQPRTPLTPRDVERAAKVRAEILANVDPLVRLAWELRSSVRDIERVVLTPAEVASPQGNEKNEHIWLRALLYHLATRAGFSDRVELDETGRDVPDVVLLHPGLNVLMVGEAKDAFHRTQTVRGSYGQIVSYFDSTKRALRARGYQCALMTIATNQIQAGLEWFSELHRMASGSALDVVPTTRGVAVGIAGTCVATTLVRLP